MRRILETLRSPERTRELLADLNDKEREILAKRLPQVARDAFLQLAKVTCPACGELATFVVAHGAEPKACLACGAKLPPLERGPR